MLLFQLIEKSPFWAGKTNKTVNDHSKSFQERVDNIVNNNLPLAQHNNYKEKEKIKNVITIGD